MINFSPLLKNKIKGEKFYLTEEGLEKIKKEYEALLSLKSFKIKEEIPQFLHSDELTQEYFDYQDDMSLLEARINDLHYILKNSEIIKTPPKNEQKIVQLGATVFVNINGEEDKFKIVDVLEADPSLGLISKESPVGKALLGHKVGDEIFISSPVKFRYKIKKIKYS